MADNNQLDRPKAFSLNRKQWRNVLDHLRTKDLSRLAQCCRRFNNLIQYYVQNLHVFVDWQDGGVHDINRIEDNFKPVILIHRSPADFFEMIPFKNVRGLFLDFDDNQEELIDLTNLGQLKYIKIRGANIQLSSNRLPSITHVDIDNPNFERQVMINIKDYHLEMNVSEFSRLYNTSEAEAIGYAFSKSFDILLKKPKLERTCFTIIMTNVNLLVFEALLDGLTNFLKNFEKEINLGLVHLNFKHNYEENVENLNEKRRWADAWNHLTIQLMEEFANFTLVNKNISDD